MQPEDLEEWLNHGIRDDLDLWEHRLSQKYPSHKDAHEAALQAELQRRREVAAARATYNEGQKLVEEGRRAYNKERKVVREAHYARIAELAVKLKHQTSSKRPGSSAAPAHPKSQTSHRMCRPAAPNRVALPSRRVAAACSPPYSRLPPDSPWHTFPARCE